MTAPIIIAAKAKHTATLIFFHGLGDTGQGWASTMRDIRPVNVKVICPTADTIPVSLNAGFRMPSWFDLRTLNADGPEDEDGIKQATKKVHTMIENEVKAGIPANRIMLGGFSQGGALALYAALNFAEQLAGVVSLSGWLPLHKEFSNGLPASNDIPILLCHGDCDPIVPYKWGQMTSSLLKRIVKHLNFKTYKSLAHTSSEEELRDVKMFVESCLFYQ